MVRSEKDFTGLPQLFRFTDGFQWNNSEMLAERLSEPLDSLMSSCTLVNVCWDVVPPWRLKMMEDNYCLPRMQMVEMGIRVRPWKSNVKS